MQCVLCHKTSVSPKFMVCSACAVKWRLGEWHDGKVWIHPRRRWPAWARKLCNDYCREYRSNRAWQARVETLTQDDAPVSRTTSGAHDWLEYATCRTPGQRL